jgi:hypothetical protein
MNYILSVIEKIMKKVRIQLLFFWRTISFFFTKLSSKLAQYLKLSKKFPFSFCKFYTLLSKEKKNRLILLGYLPSFELRYLFENVKFFLWKFWCNLFTIFLDSSLGMVCWRWEHRWNPFSPEVTKGFFLKIISNAKQQQQNNKNNSLQVSKLRKQLSILIPKSSAAPLFVHSDFIFSIN